MPNPRKSTGAIERVELPFTDSVEQHLCQHFAQSVQ
jgi:hypothetical protein